MVQKEVLSSLSATIRTFILILCCVLPSIASAAETAPPDSEMVYRANLGRAEDLKYLIRQGGRIDAVDNNGIAIFFLAAGRIDGEAVNIIHMFLSYGVKLNSKDINGRNALFHAAKAGNAESVEYLLELGIDAYVVDNNGETARSYAFKAGQEEMVGIIDSFSRKKVEEVNEAYKRINDELEKRYDEIAEEYKKVAKRSALANQAAHTAAQRQQKALAIAREVAKRQADAKAPQTRTPVIPNVTTEEKLITTKQKASLSKQEEPTADPIEEEKTSLPSEEDKAAQEMLNAIQSKLKELEVKRELQRKINEELKEIQKSTEAQKAAEERIKREEEKAKNKITKAEAAALKKDQKQKAEAERIKEEEELTRLYRELAYSNCAFQYWYYCYTANQTTELSARELREAFEDHRSNIRSTGLYLMNNHQVPRKRVEYISFSAKTRVYRQLDQMASNRIRRSRGVGNIRDLEKRCGDISLHWDIGPGSRVSERLDKEAIDKRKRRRR